MEFKTPEDSLDNPIDLSSKITDNKVSFGDCDTDTAANIINNEDKLDMPATYYMYNPKASDVSSSIEQEELKDYTENQNLKGVAPTLANARLFSLYNPHRKELAEKNRIYKQAIFDESSLVNRLYNNFMSSKYAMERKALVSEREQARKINDTELEREYDYEIDEVNKKASEYMSSDDTAGAVANLTASLVRNPELIAVGVIGGAASYASGGILAPATIGTLTTMAGGAIVFNDTRKVEAGDILEELEEKYPDMTTEERLAISDPYSMYAGGIETLSYILTPLGIAGRSIFQGAKKVAGKTFISSAKKARMKAISEAGKDELLKMAMKKTAAETMSNPNKLAYIGKKVAEYAISGPAEGAQEMTQEMLKDAYVKAVADAEDPTKKNLWQNFLDNIQDESLSSKYAKMFVDTMMAAWTVGGAIAGVSKTVSTGYNKLMAKSSMVDAENVSEKMVEAKKTSEVYKKSPKAYSEQTQVLVDVGNAPEKVVFSDVSALRKIKQEAEEAGNTVLIEKMEKAGITEEAMTQAEQTTGDLKLDLAKFDEHILDPDNEELFQKVKGLYTFDETTLTKKEMSDILSGVIEARPELKTAIEDTESVFNKTVSALSKNKNFTPAMVIDNAVAAQIKTNRIMEFEGKSSEEANKVSLEIINTKESLLDKAKGLFQIVGKKAKIPEVKRLPQAVKMAQSGVNNEEIRQKTGWYRGADGEWRYEISDKDVKFRDERSIKFNIGKDSKGNKIYKTTLNELLEDKKLFDAYSELKDVPVVITTEKQQGKKRTLGRVTNGTIFLYNDELGRESGLKTLKHEIQHIIQAIEGFAAGGSPEQYEQFLANVRSNYTDFTTKLFQDKIKEKLGVNLDRKDAIHIRDDILSNGWQPADESTYSKYGITRKEVDSVIKKDIKELSEKEDNYRKEIYNKLPKNDIDFYLRLLGEKEARDVEKRIGLTDKELMETPPVSMETTEQGSIVYNEQNNSYLFQQQAGHIAGVYTREGDKNVIKLTEAANPTSFVHEFDHLFWREALESYNSGNMIPYWKKKVEEAAKWVGAEIVDGKVNFNTEQMEKLADGFMSYMKEGKSPIASLNDLFARMAEWFVDVYKKLKMSGVRLNEKITKVFDAMLVSREEIDNALIDKRVQAIGRKKGVTEEQYQRYISDLSALRHQSTTKHIEAIRKKARTEVEERYREKKAEIRGAVIKELEADRDYQMRAFVRNVRIAEQDIPADMKLRNRELFVAEDGVPVQQVLTEYGDVVSNVGDLVDLLNSLRAPSAVVAERTEELFNDWLMNENPELSEVDAKIATANKDLIRVRVKEYLMLKGIPLERYEEYFNNLVKASDEEMANMPISYFMNTDRLMDLETKITTKARFAKSDSELADALWHQAAVDYMLGKAKDIKAKVLKFQKHFDKYKKAQTDADRKNMDAMDFDMISAILYNFRFTGRKPRVRDIPLGARLDNWVKDKLNNRFSDADIVVDYIPFLTQDRNIKSFDRMQYSDFERIDEMVHEIEDISQSDKKKVELDKRTKRVEDAEKWVNYLKDKKINLSSSAWWTSGTTMMETLLDKNMPRDLFIEYVLKEIDGINMREIRMDNNDQALKPMLQRIADNQKKVFKLNLNGRDINLTYEELQVAVLNSDNMETWVASYNKQRMDNLTTEDFIDIVSQAPEQMWKDAKVAWNIFDNQKKDFREAQYRTSGFLMGYVEPRKIKLRDGREIQTGYYPRSKRYEAAEFDSALRSSFGNGGKNMGTAVNAKDRMESGVHGDLDLSIKSLRPTLYHTATVIEVGPTYNALNSLFNDEAVRLTIGEKAYNMLNDWMQYPLVGDHVNKLFSVIDQWSSIQILGWNPRKFFVQALGFIPALSTVGLRWAAPHFMEAQTYTDLFTLEKIKKLSPYMKKRYDESEKYIAYVTDDYSVAKLGKDIKDVIMPAAMMFTARGDAFASGIVWRGSYERALAEGKTQEQAISWADHVVRITQGDSTLVSRPPILRGNAKLITKFASYFVAQNSRITSNLVGKRYLEAVVDLALAGIVSAVVESLISSAYDVGQQAILSALGLGDDKKKKEMEDFTSYALDKAKKNIWMTLGALTVPAAGIGSAAGSYIAYGKRYARELPLYGPINAVMDSINYSIALATAETEKQKQKAKKGLKKTVAQVLTIPREYVNMFITD